MSLSYVTLVLDLYDGKGDPVIAGTVTLSPNVTVTDSADHIVITQSPVTVNLYSNPVPSVQIVATDNDGLQPEGWAWLIQPQFPGAPAGGVYEVLFASGAQQYLSDLLPATEGPLITTYATAAALTAEVARAEAAEAALAVLAGTATLNGTTAVPVAAASADAGSVVLLTAQPPAAPAGTPYVSAITPGTGFSLKSTSASDTAVVVGWLLAETS